MKRILTMFLVLLMAASLFAGCGKKEAEETTTETTAETTETTTEETPAASEVTPQQVMANVNARKAIAMAIDKTYITDMILGNGSVPVDFLVPVGLAKDENGVDFRDVNPNGWNAYDVAKAQEYWTAAKEELGFETIEIEFLTYDSDSAKKVSEYIQGQLEANLPGITLVLNQQPFENKLDLANKGQFQFQYAGWGPDYPDPMTFLDMWITGSGHNDAGYSNTTYDANIDASKTGDLATKPAERWTTLQESERILLEDDAVLVPLFQRGRKFLERGEAGILDHAFGADFTFDQATTEREDGILRWTDTSDIPSMNSSIATDQVSFQALTACLEGLVMLGENDEVIPGVAETWDVSDDGLTYTFNLRDGAVWSNGTPVTAQDFVFSFKKLADPATASQYNFMIETAGIKNGSKVIAGEAGVDELGIKAIDDKTFEIQLEIAAPYFLKVMSFPAFYPINEAFFTEKGESYGTSVDTVLYNGAYTLSKWEIGYEYAYAKNATYWNAANVKNNGVSFRIIKDVNTGVNLYESGEIDRIGLDADNLPAYLDNPNLKSKFDTSVYYLVFNIANDGSY